MFSYLSVRSQGRRGGGVTESLVPGPFLGEGVPQLDPGTGYPLPTPPPDRTRTGHPLKPRQGHSLPPWTGPEQGTPPSPDRTRIGIPLTPLPPGMTRHRQDTSREVRLLRSHRRTFMFPTSFDVSAEDKEFEINNLSTYFMTLISSPILSILPLISVLSYSFTHSFSFWCSISFLTIRQMIKYTC